MKIVFSWLNEYLDCSRDIKNISHDLTNLGFPVESISHHQGQTIIDLEINANRGDCLSILGIARELAALYGAKIKSEKYHPTLPRATNSKFKIEVEINNPKICPRYSAIIIENVQIKPSPEYVQKRLVAYGFRPVNNIVDITNYVMVALGQPLHAFDFDKIENGVFRISQSAGNEKIITLDGIKRNLPAGAIIIRDNNQVIDLAGIMGGENSQISAKTKTIVLQAAVFDPVLIRRSSKALNIITEASYRYERGVDREATLSALGLANSMIYKSCPKAAFGELTDVIGKQALPAEIELTLNEVNNFLGADFRPNEIIDLLTLHNFKVSDRSAEIFKVSPPSWRSGDIFVWQDVAEELMRTRGYAKISEKYLSYKPALAADSNWLSRERIKEVLFRHGWTEISSYSFLSQKEQKIIGISSSEMLEIANPLIWETKYLRPSLLSSLLWACAKNPWAPEINIFEIGKVFSKNEEEVWQLGIASTANVENIKKALADLSMNSEIIAIEKPLLDFYKIRRKVNIAIVNLMTGGNYKVDYSSILPNICYRPISRFAPTVRDMAFIVDGGIKSDPIAREIVATSPNIIVVDLFDEYILPATKGKKKNLAYHIWLESPDSPVSEKEAEEIIQNIIHKIEDKFTAKLRGRS